MFYHNNLKINLKTRIRYNINNNSFKVYFKTGVVKHAHYSTKSSDSSLLERNPLLPSVKLQHTIYSNNKLILGLRDTIIVGDDKLNLNPYSLFITICNCKKGRDDVYMLGIFNDYSIKMLGILESLVCDYIAIDSLDYFRYIGLSSGYPVYTDVVKVEQFNLTVAKGNKKIRPTKNLKLLNNLLSQVNIITPGFTGNPFDTPLFTMIVFTGECEYATIEVMTAEYLFNI